MYYDVIDESGKLEEMLQHSDGERRVPVIVTGDRVEIGYQRGS